MTFAYLFVDTVFDILSTPLFQHFEAALLVLTGVTFSFSFFRTFFGE